MFVFLHVWCTLSLRDGVHFTSDRLRGSEANVLSAQVCRYSPEQSMCSVRQSLLRVALGLAMIELLAVHFSHLQFEFINHFHNASHLVEIAVDLVILAKYCHMGCAQHGSHELAFVLYSVNLGRPK